VPPVKVLLVARVTDPPPLTAKAPLPVMP
jgi:hypothetical protein